MNAIGEHYPALKRRGLRSYRQDYKRAPRY